MTDKVSVVVSFFPSDDTIYQNKMYTYKKEQETFTDKE